MLLLKMASTVFQEPFSSNFNVCMEKYITFGSRKLDKFHAYSTKSIRKHHVELETLVMAWNWTQKLMKPKEEDVTSTFS